MSFKIIGRAFDIPLKGNDKLVFLALCEYANDEDNTCYPSQKTLMKKATISNGSLNSCLNVLENMGFITRERRTRENGSSTSSIYTVFADIEFNNSKYKNRSELTKKTLTPNNGEGGKLRKVETLTPKSGEGVGGQTPKSGDLEPLAILNPKYKPLAIESDFNLFWDSYPNKKAKDNARKAFIKRYEDMPCIDDLVYIINNFRNSSDWTKDGGKYIPHPATWINGGRWCDEFKQQQVYAPVNGMRACDIRDAMAEEAERGLQNAISE